MKRTRNFVSEDRPYDYEGLAIAIIKQAVDDYRNALRKIHKDANDVMALSTKSEVERFFSSKWYGTLTTLDADLLLAKLRAEFPL